MSEEEGNCFFCNGFYGPTHGEYICGTCHLFLYADERHPDLVSSAGTIDENDSGNDEPSEGQLSRVLEQQNISVSDSSTSLQRSLYHRVRELSININTAQSNNHMSSPNERASHQSSPIIDHMARLPPEVVLMICRHLDALSLWSLSIACSYLTNLVQADISDHKWQKKVERYWPLYKPIYEEENWYNIFSKLVLSAPCKSCLAQMMDDIDGKTSTDVTDCDRIDNSRRLRILRQDYSSMTNEPPEGVKAMPIDNSLVNWCASIQGPVNSPYEGGLFFLYLQFPSLYPLDPPKIRFITKIFHPNVSRHGDIGLDCISHNWSLALTVAKILISIQSLFTDPYCKVSMEPSVAKLYETNISSFNRKATEWTYKYAMTDMLPLVPHEDVDYPAASCKEVFLRNMEEY